jgi:hypothetical protein
VRRTLLVLFALAVVAAALPGSAPTAAAPLPPTGVTGIALDGRVDLAWQAVGGADAYAVYRGTSPTAITTQVTPVGGVTATTFTDTTAVNGTTYYYAVRAVAGGAESGNSRTLQAKSVARACSSGNAVVLENCFPGSSTWKVVNADTPNSGGIEGFATATSINKGESIGVKASSSDTATFRIEIYRTGYYGGDGARLFSTIRGLPGTAQPACVSDATTGLLDCSNWSLSATITTTAAWPSGIYLLRLVRDDTAKDFHVLFVVRDDARPADILFGTADTTFQAYNNYGGKSLYNFNSIGGNTVVGTPRAVKVSFDRPYEQVRSRQRDWFTLTEHPLVYWLEQQGYDVAYQSETDMERNGARVRDHNVYFSPAHDEYYSAAMRTALEQARDAGVGLFFAGSNEVYWKIRFEDSPVSGARDRVQVTYKTTESGVPDPSGINTGTWRDPAGANKPENALSGVMYVGDNDTGFFPLRVSAAEGTDRVYRYTGLDAQPAGTFTNIGSTIVGWEWDARVSNGFEPPGVKTLASSPVTGSLLQDAGRVYAPGSTTVHMVKYTAASGALVFTTGTNYWGRGLARNPSDNVGEPDVRIRQVSTNVLADMGVVPQTPPGDIQLDTPPGGRPPAPTGITATALGSDSATISWSPVAGADGYSVYRSLGPRDNGQPLGGRANADLITGTTFTDIGLAPATTYFYVVTASVGGVQSLASGEVTATTAAAAGDPTRINVGGPEYTSSTNQTFRADQFFSQGFVYSVTNPIAGTNDPALYQNERWSGFSYEIPVVDGEYDVRFHFVEIYYGTSVPGGAGKRIFSMDVVDTATNPDLANLDIYAAVGPRRALIRTVSGVTVSDGFLSIKAIKGPADDPELAALEVLPRAVAAPTVTSTVPAGGQTGVARLVQPSATFSRSMDPATITSASFTLSKPDSTVVPATVAYDGATRTATLTSSAALDYSTTYTARLDTTVKAADGVALANPVTWTFTTLDAPPLEVTSTFPADAASGISPAAAVRATFSRSLDPATVGPGFSLRNSLGQLIAATVTYDDATKTATLTPNAQLTLSMTYTARLETSVSATDGVGLSAPVIWTFTTAALPTPAPTVTSKLPADGASGIARSTAVEAVFSRDMAADSINTSSFKVAGPAGAISASVRYDAPTRTGHLTPLTQLAYSTTYTVTLAATVHASDGAPVGSAVTWSFRTEDPPPPPTVTAFSPIDGSTQVARSSAVTATFSRSMNPVSLNASSFTVRPSGGAAVAANVTYDDTTRVARLTPTGPLPGNTVFTARVDTTVRAADGTPLVADVVWTFTTVACPCTLFSPSSQPAQTNLSTQDGRSGSGPWSYELGVKVRVDQPLRVTGLRFYKTPLETGTHTGRIYSVGTGEGGPTGGVEIFFGTYASETASGWQHLPLTNGPVLQPGTTYVTSVNANAYFSITPAGLASQVVAGPLRSVADGQNGVYAATAGQFPTLSWNSSNYFVDLEVVPEGDPGPPAVIARSPVPSATGVARTTDVRAVFSRPVEPSSIDASTYKLRAPGGALVAAAVTYDDASNTAILTPTSPLAYTTTYAAEITTGVRARDGTPLGAPVQWSFTVADPVPPQITRTVPTNGASDIGPSVRPRAEFSKSLKPATVNASTFTLNGPGGSVAATVAYDDATRSATLTPGSPLAEGATYTARLDGSITATDDATLSTPYTWSFTVATTAPPTVTAFTPADGSLQVARSAAPTATFSRSMDPASLGPAFTLTGPTGTVPATVSYDEASRKATLTPNEPLAGGVVFTARVATTATAADGTALAAAASWSFTTTVCPCTLFTSSAQPAQQNLSTQDGRGGSGPWTYELGVKVRVDQPMRLTALRFFKSSQETGSHTGRVWSAGGAQLAQVDFTNETASGWQHQALASPLLLDANTTYVASVNANTRFGVTVSGLATQVVSGPLRSVADGQNGVYAPTAGTFPTSSYSSSNYFTDVEVVPEGEPAPLAVTSTSPANGATGVSRDASVRATFSRPADPATVTGSTFTLRAPDGSLVPANVSYDDAANSAVLTPAAPLAYSSTFTARVTTGVRAADGSPLGANVQWSFTVADPVAPEVTSVAPAAGTSDNGPSVEPRAEFSKALAPATVNTSTVTLTGPSGAVAATVSYDGATRSAKLTPSAPLTAGSYTTRLSGSIRSADDVAMGADYTWTFAVTGAPPPLNVTARQPADGATGTSRDTNVTATFSRSVNPATVTTATFTLRAPDASLVPASVSYDETTKTATLTPGAVLAASTAYTAELTNGVQAVDGTALSGPVTWTFTTGSCPCQLFSNALTPESNGLPVQDGRSGSGPWSYELGVKFTVDEIVSLRAVRFYKDALETGSHTITIWSQSGVTLASIPIGSESGSGWQQQTLLTPIELQPGAVYVASVNINAAFGMTVDALATEVVSGPLRSVADGANGVFGNSAGTFPAQSYRTSNYFVDVVVR